MWGLRHLKTDEGVMEYLTSWTAHYYTLHPLAADLDPLQATIIRSYRGNPLCRLCGFLLKNESEDCGSCKLALSAKTYALVLGKD